MNTFTEKQRAFLQRCNVNVHQCDLDAMSGLFDDLVQANRRTNLTRITTPEEFWNLHVLDSLSVGIVMPELLDSSLRVADVGCGAGFPLLPLAWANPKLDVTGIESRGKKVEFIRAEIESLGLTNAHVLQIQAREAGRRDDLKEQFDAVLLRAVGTAGKMLRECRKLLKPAPASKIIFYKTPAAVKAERSDAKREADKFHLQLMGGKVFTLPADAGERQFLLFSSSL